MVMDGDSRSLDDESASMRHFGNADYAVFGAMLFGCSVVGLYFGWIGHRKDARSEANDYLMGGRNMQVFPVAMSLVASFISGITLLGTGTEIYFYGTQYCFIFVAIFASAIGMHYVVIPVLHETRVTSVYEYLEMRFDVRVRLFGSIMYSVFVILKLPIMIYVPAMAFNQTTGIGIHTITPIVMTICIFYTCLGGIKAVVWTDVIQIVLVYSVMLLIAIKGTISVGGLSMVIERNLAGERFEAPDFRVDPTIRHSFWTVVLGGTVFWITINGLNQNLIQRYLSLKDVATARKGQMIYIVGVSLMILLCVYNGLLLYATYHDCDPLTTKLAKAKDQITSLFAMEILKDMPGLPGLFIAGVFAAALSSLSTGLNAMSAVVLEDFCKPFFGNSISETTSLYIMRGAVIVLGVISVALVSVVEHLGAILQLSMSLPPACFAPLLGIYTIGFFIPWIGKKATLIGGVSGFAAVAYVTTRAQSDIADGLITYLTKPTSVDRCDYNFTLIPSNVASNHSSNEVKPLHHMSYLYYMPFGALITIATAFVLSFGFGFEDSGNVDAKLFAPFIRKYLTQRIEVARSIELKEKTYKLIPDVDFK